MKKIAMLFLLGLIATLAAAQSDLCWRDPYPWIPGEWAGSGSVIEAGNRFQTVTGATVERGQRPTSTMMRGKMPFDTRSFLPVCSKLHCRMGMVLLLLRRCNETRRSSPAPSRSAFTCPAGREGRHTRRLEQAWHHNGWDVESRLRFPGRVRAARASILLDSMTRIAACWTVSSFPRGRSKSSSPTELRWLTPGWPSTSTARREVKIRSSLSQPTGTG
jgi:hypothetical protein